MAKKIKLSWFDLDPAMFPADVQKAVDAVHKANTALSAKIKTLPETVAVEKAEAAADALLMPYAGRIQVPLDPEKPQGDKVPLIMGNNVMTIGYRWGKLSVASKAPAKSGKAGVNGVALAD